MKSREQPHHLFTVARRRMVEEQIRARGIHGERLLKAMEEVPRHLFVDAGLAEQSYGDYPLGIGEGQTISQPYIVALMTQALDLKGPERVLEIGTGSGYQTAILAKLVSQVYTIERIKGLGFSALRTLKTMGYKNIVLRIGDGSKGWLGAGLFDAILVTAGAPSLPWSLFEQLGEGGRLVLPIGSEESQSLTRITKREGSPVTEDLGSCRFVKLVGQQGWHQRRKAGDQFIKRSLVTLLVFFLLPHCAEFAEVLKVPQTSQMAALEEGNQSYTIKNGDTLGRIAGRFGVSTEQVLALNDVDPSRLRVGRRIIIPSGANRVVEERPDERVSTKSKKTAADFLWPVQGRVTSSFGRRRGRHHDGIDISSKRGTSILAAAPGLVLYSGRMSGYGNLVVLKHGGNYFTAYAHLDQRKVAKGKRVNRGEKIGTVGQTGRASSPHLHFEIRRKTVALNPLDYLSRDGFYAKKGPN